jgi:hypothetical protein
MAGDLLRRTRGHDPAAMLAGAGPHIDHPVAGGDDAHLVFDDDNGVTGIHESLQLLHQQIDIGGVQARRRFVEDIERRASRFSLQLGGELDPLGFTAR